MIEQRVQRYGLRIKAGDHFEIVNPDADPRYKAYWTEYYRLTQRKGISETYAELEMRRRTTLIGAMLVHMGDADGMLWGCLARTRCTSSSSSRRSDCATG